MIDEQKVKEVCEPSITHLMEEGEILPFRLMFHLWRRN